LVKVIRYMVHTRHVPAPPKRNGESLVNKLWNYLGDRCVFQIVEGPTTINRRWIGGKPIKARCLISHISIG